MRLYDDLHRLCTCFCLCRRQRGHHERRVFSRLLPIFCHRILLLVTEILDFLIQRIRAVRLIASKYSSNIPKWGNKASYFSIPGTLSKFLKAVSFFWPETAGISSPEPHSFYSDAIFSQRNSIWLLPLILSPPHEAVKMMTGFYKLCD